ncbi:hypothetical protein BGX38DRAFT_93532 [Terfezia claveryi]|nr:hypothetical protein BGX38DRAFT_93532 [Terfezia claveryi]
MADGSSMYKDLFAYEDEDKAPVVVAPPITKEQAAPCPAAKAGKKSHRPKHPRRTHHLATTTGEGNCDSWGPLPETHCRYHTGYGSGGIMRARWLLGGNRRFGKATSSVVVFFNKKLAVESHLKMRRRWLPIDRYEFLSDGFYLVHLPRLAFRIPREFIQVFGSSTVVLG